MSVGIDLGDLGIVSLVPDLGPAQVNTWFDLGNSTINGVSLGADQGSAFLLQFHDLTNTLGTATTQQDQGPSFTLNFSDPGMVDQADLLPQDTTLAYWMNTGFDTVAATEINWLSRTPLAAPPTPHTVTNISTVRLGESAAVGIGAPAPPPHLWVGDTNQGQSSSGGLTLLTKIDGSNPAAPSLVTQIDLSTYGTGLKSVRVNAGKVFVGPKGPKNSQNTAPFVIVDASTNAIIGLGSVSTGGDQMRPVDFAFDGAGNVYVLGFQYTTTTTTIYKYNIAAVLAAYPAVYSTPLAKFPTNNHCEQITFGGGFIWGSSGQNALISTNRFSRIDPSVGTVTFFDQTDASMNSAYGCLYAFGSLWGTGGGYTIYRFNPATWPSAPTIIVIDPSHVNSNSAELAADNTTIWVSNGFNFVSSLRLLYRVSTGLGTEAVIAHPAAPSPLGTTQGVIFDGRSTIWTTLRFAPNPADVGLASFSTGLGTEAFIQNFNPGGTFKDPVTVSGP